MIRRARTLRVWPGYLAFPGGVLESDDVKAAGMACGEPDDFTRLAPPHFVLAGDEWDRKSPDRERLFRSLVLAGLRELLEETGIDLGKDDLSVLCYLGRRVTPREFSRRFDTHFFAARAPEGAVGALRSGEVEGCLWVYPARALRLYAEGQWPIVPPTLDALRALSLLPDVETALAVCRLPELDEGSDSRDRPPA